VEAGALRALSAALGKAGPAASAEELQGIIYDVGRAIPRYQDPAAKGATPDKPGVSSAGSAPSIRCCWARSAGPDSAAFIELYGIDNTRKLIERAVGRRAGREGRVDSADTRGAGVSGRTACAFADDRPEQRPVALRPKSLAR
jgi:hypothetical protein